LNSARQVAEDQSNQNSYRQQLDSYRDDDEPIPSARSNLNSNRGMLQSQAKRAARSRYADQ